jgi:deoxyxylulose-5-phosphate synthase
VILRAVKGGVEISAIDPVASMQAIDNKDLQRIADEVRQMLVDAVEAA